jgi:hypothetical protein
MTISGLAVANSLAAVKRGRAPDRMHHQRHRRARRQLFARRDRDDHEDPQRPLSLSDRHPHRAPLQRQPDAHVAHQFRAAAQQGHRRRNAFAHEAGIHQDGYLKERTTYEIIDPKSVGVPEGKLVLGKHSGRHALKNRCEDLGFNLSKEELDVVYTEITALADAKRA